MSPLNKALKAKSPPSGWDLVWLRFSITIVIESVLPRLVTSSNHMEGSFMPPAWRTYTDSSYAAIVTSSRAFVQGKLAWVGLSAVSLDTFFSQPSRLSVSCLTSHQLYWSFTRAGLRRSSLTSCQRVLSLSTTTSCSEGRPRVVPWPYFHYW